jgi:hypothetical protein
MFMRIRTRWQTLAASVVAAASLVAVPAAQADGQHQELPFAKLCHRAVHNPNLTAEQRAAVAAACAKLKADLRAAKTKLDAAVAAARAQVQQAHDAVVAACTGAQFNSDACRSARAQAEQVKQQAMQDAKAAHAQFVQDVRAAVNAFKSALRPIKESLQGGGQGPGKHTPPVGAT